MIYAYLYQPVGAQNLVSSGNRCEVNTAIIVKIQRSDHVCRRRSFFVDANKGIKSCDSINVQHASHTKMAPV
jgi:hypothetical protein